MRNIKAVIEYDGTNYHGFQKQPKQKLATIQGTLENSLMRVLKEPIKVIGAGRTDAGVHAEGQVINFTTNSQIPLEKIPLAINSRLPSDIVIKDAVEEDLNFHAQFNAKGKYYVYKIYHSRIPSVFNKQYAYFIPYELNEQQIKKGCRLFIGKHDFKGFCASGTTVKNFERNIYSFYVNKKDNIWEFHIIGNGFLYNMVRIIIGTLLELGKGKRDIESIKEVFLKKDRTLAGQTAPPNGLYLKKVFYS